MATNKPLITVFGSHHPKPKSDEYAEAETLGKELAAAGFAVATGGYGGTMEAVLKGAGGGTGFTAMIFPSKANRYVKEEIRSPGLFERIATIVEGSDGFVCLKGGTGTLLELASVWELVNKKMVPYKPIVCVGPFWRNVISTLTSESTIEGLSTLRKLDRSAVSYVQFVDLPTEAAKILSKQLVSGAI